MRAILGKYTLVYCSHVTPSDGRRQPPLQCPSVLTHRRQRRVRPGSLSHHLVPGSLERGSMQYSLQERITTAVHELYHRWVGNGYGVRGLAT